MKIRVHGIEAEPIDLLLAATSKASLSQLSVEDLERAKILINKEMENKLWPSHTK